MAVKVIAKQTVGGVEYQLVDSNLLFDYVAKKGTIAIIENEEKIYINVDGGSDWMELSPESNSSVYSHNNGNAIYYNTFTVGGFYLNSAFGFTNWTGTTDDYFTYNQRGQLIANENYVGKFLCITTSQFLANSAHAWRFNVGSAKNNTLFYPIVGGDVAAVVSASTNLWSARVYNLDGNVQDKASGAFSVAVAPFNRYYTPRNLKMTLVLLQSPKTLVFDGFENGTFTSKGWTTVQNGQTNQWWIGSATASGGTYSAYVSQDSGTTATYNKNSSSVSHFYKDFKFPPLSAISTVHLSFRWKSNGETTYDWGEVFAAPTSVTPIAGTKNNSIYSLGKKYSGTTTWQFENINFPLTSAYTDTRLIFSWVNDWVVGADPGFCIDNINFYYY